MFALRFCYSWVLMRASPCLLKRQAYASDSSCFVWLDDVRYNLDVEWVDADIVDVEHASVWPCKSHRLCLDVRG
jgi:hypothetical protein